MERSGRLKVEKYQYRERMDRREDGFLDEKNVAETCDEVPNEDSNDRKAKNNN